MDVARSRVRIVATVTLATTLAAVAAGLFAGTGPAFAATLPEVSGLSATLDRTTGVATVSWDPYRSFGAGTNRASTPTSPAGRPPAAAVACPDWPLTVRAASSPPPRPGRTTSRSRRGPIPILRPVRPWTR